METIISIFLWIPQKLGEFIQWVSGYSLALGILLFLIIISVLKYFTKK